MTTKESVGNVKTCAEIVGDKWTPQLLRFFVNEEVVRFCQLQDLVEGINPRTLSARLDKLEREKVIVRNPTTSSSRCEYSLTQKGKDLLPLLQSMQAWGEKYAAINA